MQRLHRAYGVAAGLVCLLASSLVGAESAAGGPKGTPAIQRVYGDDRYATAINVSRLGWVDAGAGATGAHFQAGAVVLARGDQYADALAGVPFAAVQQAPILLTEPQGLRDDVKNEIKRVLTPGKTVYILGGTTAVSDTVVKEVAGLGYQVVRFGGADRFHTALAIAQQGIKNPQRLYVVNGDDFADAMAAGPLAATGGWTPASGVPIVRGAILLTDNFRIDRDVAAYIRAHPSVAVGGHAVEAMKAAIGPAYQAFGVIESSDRYGTADNIAMGFYSATAVGVATGTGWADALTGGAYLAEIGAPLVMPDPRLVSMPSWDHLTASNADITWSLANVYVFGGPKAISPGVYDWVKRVTDAH